MDKAELIILSQRILTMAGDIAGEPLAGNVPAQPHVGAPGQTIAEGAAHALEAQGFHAGPGGGFGHNAHVKTPQGEKLFKEPIGALIIPHAHPQLQHQAEHAVESGTHKYVQSGEHTYAVAKDADVHVPKDTDIHDENDVKKKSKVIVGKTEGGKKVHATITPATGPKVPPVYEHGPHADESLSANWKKLPSGGQPKKPVSLNGAHAGWVPHDWKVYKHKGVGEAGASAKWVQSPDGKWYIMTAGGLKEAQPAQLSDKLTGAVKSGTLEEVTGGHPPLGSVPHLPKEGAEPAKVDVGGVSVTHAEIKSAIEHLNAAKSTNVAPPLKAKGHPLAAMDYMAVAKKELKEHPELKVPSGTKQKHVGQVKLAVLHHLHAKSAELAKNEAEHHAADEGLHATEAAAAHAQKLTPSVAEFPKEESGHGIGPAGALDFTGKPEEADKWLADHAPDLTDKQAEQVKWYTGMGAWEANPSLRSGDQLPSHLEEKVKVVDSAMTPIPVGLELSRVVHANAFPDIDDLSSLAGTTYTDGAFMSTSLGDPPKVYPTGVLMHITAPEGTPAIFVGGLSIVNDQREVLLARGTQLEVSKVAKKDAGWELWARVKAAAPNGGEKAGEHEPEAPGLGPGGGPVPIPDNESSYKPVSDNVPETHEPEPTKEEAPPAAPVGVIKSKNEPASWGGVQVTTEQLHDAAKWLEETQTSKAGFKAGMKKLGNPMADADYMGVAKAWKDAHPEAKGLNTKQLMLAHVNELLDSMDKADEETGHNEAAQLHEAIEAAEVSPKDAETADGAATEALKAAAEDGQPKVVTVAYDGKFSFDPVKQYVTFLESHNVPFTSDQYGSINFPNKEWPPSFHVHPLQYEQQYALPLKDTLAAVLNLHDSGNQILDSPPEVENGLPSYPDYAQHQEIEDGLSKIKSSDVIKTVGHDEKTSSAVVRALWMSHNSGTDYYVSKASGSWQSKAAVTPGSYGAPGEAYYHITTNHVVVRHYEDGTEYVMPGQIIAKFVQDAAPAPQPEKGEGLPVLIEGKTVAEVPAGSKLYVAKTAINPDKASKYAKFPDGSWHFYSSTHGGKHTLMDEDTTAEVLKHGNLKEITEDAASGKVTIEQDGYAYQAEPGTTQWKDAQYPELGTFLRQPDGKFLWWPAGEEKPDEFGDSDATMKDGILSGDLAPHGAEAEEYAKALGAAKNTVPAEPKPEPETPEPEVPKPPVEPDVKVAIGGEEKASVPAGSKVYWVHSNLGSEDEAVSKYVKLPSASWAVVNKYGLYDSGSNFDGYVSSGSMILSGETPPSVEPEPEESPEVVEGETAPEVTEPEQAEPETAPEEVTPAGIPALYYNSANGSYKVAGEFPAGSQLYTYSTTPNGHGNTYAKAPDGQWYNASSNSPTQVYDQQSKVDNGSLTPTEPPTAAQLEQIGTTAAIHQALKTSTVPAPYKSWQQAAAAALASTTTGSKDYYVSSYPSSPDTFTYSKWQPYNAQQTWHISYGTLTGEHTAADGTTAPISHEELKQAVAEHTVPSSVSVHGKVYKYGFYYKSDKSKAYLEVKPGNSGYSSSESEKAQYIWHDTQGNASKKTSTYAANFLTSGAGDHYYAAPKPETGTPAVFKPVSYVATGDKPATWQQWDWNKHAPADVSWEKHGDGSVSSHTTAGSSALEGDGDKLWSTLLGSGGLHASLIDQYQNSVVTPGVQPGHLVVFGTEQTPEKIKTALEQIQQSDMGTGWTPAFKEMLGTWDAPTQKLVKAFVVSHSQGAMTGDSQKTAAMGLLSELLQVPQQPSGTNLSGGIEPVFLKGLPPGISTSKDVFSWTGKGYAKPFGGAAIGNPAHLDTPSLKDKINAVSADFGGGKVVGTHISSLSKGEKAQWLAAWKKGDMTAVFALDAKGGKVSPAHPGAPDNVGTHKITWSPWNPAETPASETVEGEWTKEGVQIPLAEADNYIIKAGLQHPEYLSIAEKKQWVQAHRQHDQDKVDALSKLASDRWQGGGAPFSQPAVWSDDIKPAKSYDAFLDEEKPATYWPLQASSDFLADHVEETAPFIAQWAQENGYSSSLTHGNMPSYGKEAVVQKWMDAKKAELEAEQSIPVWSKTPGTVSGGTHEIFELTKTIPLTGAKSQWMFKPGQHGQAFIADQEHAATQLANAWGFKTPASQLMEFGGKYGQAQAKLNAVSDLSYGVSGFYDNAPIPWQEFSAKQVSDIAREHVLDWALDNNDARASNFLVMPDGSVIGIDKGAAWKNFGKWNGLAGDSKADVQSRQVSTMLYDAIRAHEIGKDTADQAYIAAIQRAQKMQKLGDDHMRSVLEAAFAKRTDFGNPGSREALIQASIDRKNSLAADFGKMWEKIYKQAGWTLPEVPEAKLPLNKQGVQLHSGFSDADFFEHVAATKSAGTHAFFGGTELDHSGFTVWKEYEGKTDDKPIWWGESTAVGPAYQKLIDWATEHQSATPGSGYTGSGGGTLSKDVEVKGEKAFYDKIIGAGKTVSHHSVDKQYNAEKMSAFDSAVKELEELQKQAEALVGTDKEDDPFHGTSPANVADMAKFYLRLSEKVNEAKDNGGTFKPGDLPRWEAPPTPKKAEEADKMGGIKVELTAPYRPAAHVTNVHGYASQLGEDHQLHTDGSKHATGESSNVWKITLPTGEEIEFSDGKSHGVEKAFHGRLRFRTRQGDAASMERIKSALQMMGLGMKDAEEHDMELHYWRHLALILSDRMDGRDSHSKYAKVWGALSDGMKANGMKFQSSPDDLTKNVFALEQGGLPAETELGIWRKAWATVTSKDQVEKWVASGAHLPHMRQQDVTSVGTHGGVPFWYRFDMDQKFLAGKQLVAHHFYAQNKAEAATGVVHGGGLLSAEERLRYLGMWLNSSFGNPASYGATKYVFLRLNHEKWSDADVLLSPKILARTTNYAFSDDSWGNVDDAKDESYFDPANSTAWKGSANETMVDASATLLDDIELVKCKSESQREQILSYLKSVGVTEIRGMPIEQRIVTHISDADIKKIHDQYASNPDLVDPIADVQNGQVTPVALTWNKNDVVVVAGANGKKKVAA